MTATATPAEASPTPFHDLRLAGVRLSTAGVLAAILALVGVVSLPLIADYARRTNEADARRALALLGERLFTDAGPTSSDLPALVAADPRLEHRLRDARRVGEGETLLFHGYYYRLDPAERSLVAWPRRAGGTGHQVYAWVPASGLWSHANDEGRWSGPEPEAGGTEPVPVGADGDWSPCPPERG